MRRIRDEVKLSRGIVTYELADGRRVDLDVYNVQHYGARAIVARMGIKEYSRRLPVVQCGHIVGYLPEDFDPQFAKSKSYFYDFRPGDFVREGDKWVANSMLGPGDLDAVQGFTRELVVV